MSNKREIDGEVAKLKLLKKDTRVLKVRCKVKVLKVLTR